MTFTSKRSAIESPKILLNLLVMTMRNRDTIEKYKCRTVTVSMKVWSREESSNLGSEGRNPSMRNFLTGHDCKAAPTKLGTELSEMVTRCTFVHKRNVAKSFGTTGAELPPREKHLSDIKMQHILNLPGREQIGDATPPKTELQHT